jgi:hypothetical protein
LYTSGISPEQVDKALEVPLRILNIIVIDTRGILAAIPLEFPLLTIENLSPPTVENPDGGIEIKTKIKR